MKNIGLTIRKLIPEPIKDILSYVNQHLFARKTIQKKETKCSKCSTTINNSPITDNRLKKIKSPNEKCKNCGDKCNQYFLYCKPCAKKHNNLMREIKLRENKKTKTRLRLS